ncbi:hypothetical protein ALC57_03888 [Trachymyrmex cornetzi]|uniref:Uncharacterized protein n=1 Tax=Trachymyrmex cornetzi TaxID=471704 RepID=A0A151JM38_9HYME|nr:hypothetical protein ALC57_03888 [Trachymyrmex cornetzi]
MEEILSDSNTYEVPAKDPIRKLTQDLRALLVRWKRDSFIDDQTYRRLLTIDDVLPRVYGLTKIYKDGNPLRVIVSSINSPLYCSNINLLPEIYLIALKYLCTSGSSVPVERLFSATEYIISERK